MPNSGPMLKRFSSVSRGSRSEMLKRQFNNSSPLLNKTKKRIKNMGMENRNGSLKFKSVIW